MANRIDRRTFVKKSAAALVAGKTLTDSLQGMPPNSRKKTPVEWPVYGCDQSATRYSPLDQINRSNAGKLKIAWTHHTGDSRVRPATTIECTPIVVDGVMYITTAQLKIQALDAATGKLLWTFDPFGGKPDRRSRGVNRGVTYWSDGDEGRIFCCARHHLFGINAKTGKRIESFGEGGRVDLRRDLDRDIGELSILASTPGPIYKDLLILGTGGGEGPGPAAPGHIRAFDVRTGKRRWIFHTIPHPGEFGYDTWPPDTWQRSGGANCWGGMSVDETRGLVFAATGSPTFDFFGGDRLGQNLFANCVLALKAETGERVWHFQTVHHDFWDYDLPCQPVLVTVRLEGRRVDAVAQVTKMGWIFLLDRETGKPLFPVEERPTPKSDVPGEEAWPTQPFPTKPPSISRQRLSEEGLANLSPESHAALLAEFKKIRSQGIFTPPSKQGTVIFPGTLGGGLWGAGAFDPATGRMFVASTNLPYIMALVEAKPDRGYRYRHTGYNHFRDPAGYPACKPPWGLLTAVDMNEGEIVWQKTLGEFKELTARGLPPTGTQTIGGAVATKGGLVFIAATKDEKFRAFDAETGKILWDTELPAGGYATPCTYQLEGKQYVVIAAGGGGKNRTRPGDSFVAFALP